MLSGVTVFGESSQHVEKALCSHDAVDDLTQEVGMAVVTGVFFNHMHQHPTYRRASGTRCIAPQCIEIAERGDHGPGMRTLRAPGGKGLLHLGCINMVRSIYHSL